MFYILMLFHQVDHYWKLEIKLALIQTPCDMLARLLCHGEVWPIKTKCFVGNLLYSFLIVFEDYHVHHKFAM